MILVINMLLKKLIKNLPDEKKNIKVRGIADDSRKIKKGFIFLVQWSGGISLLDDYAGQDVHVLGVGGIGVHHDVRVSCAGGRD